MIFTIIISLILFALAGLLWGMREYYHKNPKVFDVLWKVKPISFFGSQSWKLKYKDYDNGDTRPAFPLAKVFPVNDFWHSASYVFKLLLIVVRSNYCRHQVSSWCQYNVCHSWA